MSDFEKWDVAVKNLRDVVLAQWKIISAFLIGFVIAWIIVGIFSLITPERLCS